MSAIKKATSYNPAWRKRQSGDGATLGYQAVVDISDYIPKIWAGLWVAVLATAVSGAVQPQT